MPRAKKSLNNDDSEGDEDAEDVEKAMTQPKDDHHDVFKIPPSRDVCLLPPRTCGY
jgi:hypothetical protein